MLLAVLAPWAAMAQTVTIGTGTDTQYESPMDNYYNYSFVEMIYTADEIAAGHPTENTILSVGFHLASQGLNDKTYTITVYMKNIDATSFESASHVAFASTDAVTTKNVTATASGWVTVELDTPFTYDPTKSLLIGVNKTAGGYAGSSYKWSYTTTTEYRHLRNHQDTPAAYDPTTPPTYPTRDYKRPNVQLTFGVPPTCFAPQNLTCTEHTATSATLTWQRHASGTENAWVLQYSTDNTFATGVLSVNVSNTPSKELTGLTAEQTYYARVRPDCDENLWSNVCEFKPSNSVCSEIGTGTTPSSSGGYGGIYTYFNYYAYTQQLYTAAELAPATAGVVQSIALRFAEDTDCDLTFEVYLGQTTSTSLSSAWISNANLTKVYEGTTTFSGDGEWNDIDVTTITEWEWDGTSNIVVAIRRTDNSSPAVTYPDFYYTSATDMCRYFSNSSSNIELNSSNIPSSTGTVTANRPDMKFCVLPSSTPKPRNIQVSDITASQATVSWEAPATGSPTGYEYQIKVSGDEWPASWTSAGNNLSVEPTGLTASTDYVVRVRATYAEGESGSIETEFRTLDACAFPTNLLAYTAPGEGTKATLSWRKGYEENAWVLQYGTDIAFTEGTYTEENSGFIPQTDPGLENVVVAVLNGLTPDQTYYARVQADCGGGSTSTWSNVATFTPSNYVDYTYGANASTTSSCIPFYGTYANDERTISQYIIPATELANVAGGTIRSLTYYTNSTPNWGTATVKVYVKEVNRTTFASSSASEVEDWETMTQVYNGSLTVSGGQMTITFDNTYLYGGGNLMIGIKMDQTGTSASVSWSSIYNSSAYTGLYAYYSTSYYSTGMSYNRSNYYPKTTINYQPTPYKYPVIDEANCTFGTTSAHIAWTVTGATPTGYQYQYKSASATEWPTTWTSATTAYADLSDLTPGSFYDFRVKALYDGDHESVAVNYGFFTECAAITAFPWSEKFEAYSAGDFSHPCWVNEHISGEGTSIFKVYTTTTGSNTTHQLQLPDQSDGTLTKLRLPEMTLPNNGYQFVIDVYRSSSYDTKTGEGIRVYASTNGEIEGATELAFIPRLYSVASGIIPAEATGNAWYTYELPIGMSGTCYIILRGENQFGTSTYMDNLTVEEIPTCARPTDLAKSEVTNHSATLTWTAGDPDQHNWQVAYSKTSFDPNTANFDLTTVETVDFTTGATCTYRMDKLFDAESTYYLYIRANCGTATEPDYGPWSRKGINLTTLGASPAPSNFTASNIGSQTADLVWTAGGGDYELSWDLYYVQSDDAPTAPTEETHATKTVTTLPTTENPYTLDGLREESRYYIWVRANHTINSVTTHSAWVALTGNFFTTLAACPTPTGLAYNNLTAVSADLSWVGSPDVTDYTVQYRTSAGMSTTVLSEHFDVSGVPTGWTKYTGLVDEVIDGTVTLSSTTSGWNTNTYALGTYNMKVNVYGSSCKYWLVTPEIELGTGNVLNFDLALTDYGNANVIEYPTQQPDDRFVVLVYADDAWHILREWNNSGSEYVYNTIATAGENVTIALSLYSGKTVKIAFYGESTVAGASSGVDDNDLHIDNVEVGTPTDAGEWITAVDDVETQSYQLTGLTGGVKYDVHVKSNCTSGEYCEPISFTTLADGNKVFTNAAGDGKWGTAGNWAPTGAPVLADNVIIRADVTIESNCVAQANSITFEGTPIPTLTIDNGKLKHLNSGVRATVKKTIRGYGAGNEELKADYYLITNPLTSSVTPDAENNHLLSGNYDLYSFDYMQALEWRNNVTSLSYGAYSYLYANESNTDLSFTGTINAYSSYKNRSLTASTSTSYDFPGWYLLGNPYMYDAYLANGTSSDAIALPYIKMNDEGNGFENVAAGTPIEPMQGFFYQAVTGATNVYVVTFVPTVQSDSKLNMNLSRANKQLDNAILVFGGDQQLGKMTFRANSSKVYMPVEGKDYAITSVEGQVGEVPVSFVPESNGTYSLSFTSEEVSFSYLHLIDNMTGNDVNLLETPSYSFDARTTDYESRFRLVFATGSSTGSDTFGFVNASGNFCIFGIEGEATVQVIDVLGHVLSSETFSGSYEKKINGAPGVYMVRLLNGNDVKVQKVVVR